MMDEQNKLPDNEQNFSATEDSPLNAFETVTKPTEKRRKSKRLSANTRLLIAITAIVAVLAILVAVLLPLLADNGGDTSSSSDTTAEEEVIPIINRTAENSTQQLVQAITIQNADGEYTIRYNTSDKAFELVGYEDISLGTDVTSLVENVTKLNGYDKINTVESLSDFGLDKPAATVNVTYSNGNVSLLVGDATPDENGYYLTLKDSNEVYMVDYNIVDLFLYRKGQYVYKTLIASPTVKEDDSDGLAVLKEVTLQGGPNNETLTIRRSESSDGIEYSYANFIVTKPYKRLVNDTANAKLTAFNSLVASEAVVIYPTAADKEKYGFNKPYAILDVTLAVQTTEASKTASSTDEETESKTIYYNTIEERIIVGSKDSDNNYYVMLEDSKAIYYVTEAFLSQVAERTYDNTISELLFLKDISEIGKVNFTINGIEYGFTLAHDETKEESDDQLTVTYKGTKLGTQDFRELYTKIMGLARYGKVDRTIDGQPKHTLNLFLNDGSTYLAMDFYEYSSSLYAVKTTEGELFTIKSSDINKLLTQVTNYVNGKGVADI